MEYRARNLERALEYRAAYKERELQLAKDRHLANPEPRRASVRKWQQGNPEKVRARNVAEYHSNPDKHRERAKAWRIANPEKNLANVNEWRHANKDKVKAMNHRAHAKADKALRLAKGREWQNANREKVRASVLKWNREHPGCTAKRKATKLNATPSWANEFFINEAYQLAKLRTEMLGFAWQVDHIVPLISKSVCGFHCEDNMQVIPAKNNAAKGNRFWPDLVARPNALSA
jgi:hypothetical protein